MAHELTHVSNRDVLVMTLAGFFATIAAYIVQFGFLFGGGRLGDDDDNPSFMVLFLVSLGRLRRLVLLMQALSRYREFAADRGAAIITAARARSPRADEDLQRHAPIPQKDLRASRAARSTSSRRRARRIGGLFATHPPMEKRIAALQRLEAQLQGTGVA
jgi:heat shock protein HtpX